MDTTNDAAKRQLLYLPSLNPHSFLLFFQKGANPHAWSLRDYSDPARLTVQYARDLGHTADELLNLSKFRFPAPAVPVTDLAFWHSHVSDRNAAHGLTRTAAVEPPPVVTPGFPLLAESELLRLPKAAKAQDMRRIRTSPNSEDWVTWNLLHLLQRTDPNGWWRTLEAAATRCNPHARLDLQAEDSPRLAFWHCAPSPAAYERESRRRMRESGSVQQMTRAAGGGPVEGESEIDVILDTRRFLVFIEAKLGSDISARTTYDPSRNQIARNIDCAIEAANGRTPVFWMLVRDTDPSRMYVQLMQEYAAVPELLHRALPHRDLTVLRQVAGRLSIIRWSELAAGWLSQPSADPLTESVRMELIKRV